MKLERIRLPAIVLSAALALACACAPPPEGSTGQLRLGIVQDSAIFQVIEAFQIQVIKATTTAGASVTCSDIPGTFRVGNPQLVSVIEPVGFAWKPSSDEAHTPQPFQVPADEKLVIIVQGLARQTTSGVHTVARGCVDSKDEGGARVALAFKAGSTQDLAVDVRATTGAACATQAETAARISRARSATRPSRTAASSGRSSPRSSAGSRASSVSSCCDRSASTLGSAPSAARAARSPSRHGVPLEAARHRPRWPRR